MAISPQREPYIRQLVKKHGLTFEVLRDEGNVFAGRLGLTYRFPDDLRKVYMDFGIDLERYNGDDSWTLPMPGRFIVGRDSTVHAADVSPDYTVRPEPAETVRALRKLPGG